jgi:hypothetical protein
MLLSCAVVLQARSLKDALVAMDCTIINIKEFAAWYSKYSFIAPGEGPAQRAQLALVNIQHEQIQLIIRPLNHCVTITQLQHLSVTCMVE